MVSRFVPHLLTVVLAGTSVQAHAQSRSALGELSRGSASVVVVASRDTAGTTLSTAAGVFVDIGRLVVPRTVLLQKSGTPAIVYGGREQRITAVLADDPRSGLALVAVDLPDGAPSAIRVRSSRAALRAGSYRALTDDGLAVNLDVGDERDLPGIGAACQVTTHGTLPASGSPVVDANGEMIGILVERSALDVRLTVLVPATRAVALPSIPPTSVRAWLQAARDARAPEAEAAFLRGLDASLADRPAQAAEGFREAARHGEDADARAALAASQLAAGDRDGAIAAYREAVQAAPQDPRFHHALGVVLSDADRWEEAAREFAEVARLRPADSDAQFNAGTAYGHIGRFDEEYRAYRAALQQNPAHVNALRNLGITCIALKRYDEAVAATARALRFRPSDARLHAQLGVAYYDLKDYAAAISELQQAVALDPAFVQGHYGLAVAYAASGQRDAARQESERVRALDPARGAEVARLLR